MRRRPTLAAACAVSAIAVACIGIAAVSDKPPAPEPPTFAVVGDQYTAGRGDSQAWPAVLAERTGWSIVNVAAPFTGYDAPGPQQLTYSEQVDRALATRANVIVIVGGVTDARKPEAAISVGASDALKKVTLGGGSALIVGPTWYGNSAPMSVTRMSQTVEAVARKRGVPFLDALNPPFLTRSQMNADASAPNDEGQAVLAERIGRWLLASQA